ncbi:MAG TPA: UpxY family transcription antiterminator [Bacteroidales bacterium]|nr:UpxY family transcription antiterminator [Bacteroidales bacterium]
MKNNVTTLQKSHEYNWYVIYVNSRSEKKVVSELQEQAIHAWAPLVRTLRQWSDRRKMVEVPLFTGYVFVKIRWRDYLKVLQTPNVVAFVRFESKPAIVPPYQIDNLKILIQEKPEFRVTNQHFETGDPVIIEAGPLKGLQGHLIKKKGKTNLLIEVEGITRQLVVDIHAALVTRNHLTAG